MSRQFVTMDAMSFGRIDRRNADAVFKRVLSRRGDPQMRWIHTSSISACVIDLMAVRNKLAVQYHSGNMGALNAQ